MSKSLIRNIFIFLSLAGAFPALAQQSAFSEPQKAEIKALVREYILENPEIIPEAVEVLQARDQARRIAALGDALYAGPGAVVQGNPQGDATLVEFFDYRCPYCKRGWQTIKRLIEEDPNLRVVFRQFPIKDAPGETISYDAARAALAAARQGKYLAFHDAVFANPTVLTKERVMEIAAKVGLDMDRLKKDMADPAIAQGIEESMMMAATLRLTGTPSYVVGESIISGLISYEGLEQRIAAQRAAGRPAVAGGR